MTNHIEELMKAAGVVPVHLTDCSFINIRKGYDVGTDCCPAVEDERLKCEDCEHSKETQLIYPAFTPAKQLELIKLIGKELVSLNYRQHKDFYAMQVNSVNRYCGIYKEADTFEELLADIIVELIKFGELNKSEVKRILSGAD